MAAEILDGLAMGTEIQDEVRTEVHRFVKKQVQAPGLLIVRPRGDAPSGL